MNSFGKKMLGILKAMMIPVAVYVFFGLLSGGRMFNTRSVLNVLRTAVQPAIICYMLALGMSVGVLNFSAGAIVVCAAVIGNGISNLLGFGLVGFCVFSILVALACSSIFGLLYNWLRVPAMVLGLGVMLIFESIPRLLFPEGATIAQADSFLARSPYIFIVLFITIVVFYVLYNLTSFGHNLRAIGSNQSVALAAGLDLDKIKFSNCVVGGLFLGIAGILYLSSTGRVENVAPLGSMAVMMDSFMGVFLGILLSQWADMSFSVYFGVLTMKILSVGFVSVGFEHIWKDVVTGFFMLIIMAVSANAHIPAMKKADKMFAAEAARERTGSSL